MPDPAVIALLCRTSDRTAGGARGAAVLADLLADRLGVDARMIGTPGQARVAGWEDDLRDSRGCILEAGGQVDDALSAGRFPLLLSSDCSICLTTLPTVARLVPEAKLLWLDAHGDFNTPATTPSGFLGGMCLAGACSRWESGFDGGFDPANVIMVGVRDVDSGEHTELEEAGVRRLQKASQIADAVDGAAVYVHVDLDVLDPTIFPAQFPAEGGLADDDLRLLLDEAAQAAGRIVGVEITAFEAPEDPDETAALAELAADAVEPLLPLGE